MRQSVGQDTNALQLSYLLLSRQASVWCLSRTSGVTREQRGLGRLNLLAHTPAYSLLFHVGCSQPYWYKFFSSCSSNRNLYSFFVYQAFFLLIKKPDILLRETVTAKRYFTFHDIRHPCSSVSRPLRVTFSEPRNAHSKGSHSDCSYRASPHLN